MSKKKIGVLLIIGIAMATALVLALSVTAVAQVGGVNNEAEDCVGNSCNTGNVADVDVDNDCLIVAVDVAVIDGGGLIINDTCNTDVTVNQSQTFEKPKEAAPAAAAGYGAGKLPVTGASATGVGMSLFALAAAGMISAGYFLTRKSRA